MVGEIGGEVVEEARLAGTEDGLQAAALEELGVAPGDLDGAEVGAGPVGLQLCPAIGQEGAADALVGDDAGEAVEDLAEHIFDAQSALGLMDDLEELQEFGFAAGAEFLWGSMVAKGRRGSIRAGGWADC